MKPIHLQRYHDQLYEEAAAKVPLLSDGSRDEARVLEELAKLITVDVESEKLRRAKEIIDSKTKMGAHEPIGQLMLPLGKVPYEPQRLLRDEAGHIVEQDAALAPFTDADARRARDHAQRAAAIANQKTDAASIHAQWAMEQLRHGRPALELKFGACIRETGRLIETPPPAPPSPEPDIRPTP